MMDHINKARGNRQDFVEWGGTLIPMLMFADDIVLLAKTGTGMSVLMTAVQDFCKAKQLKINYGKGKTEVLIANPGKPVHRQRGHAGIVLGQGTVIQQTNSYKYLGVITDGRGAH